MKKKIGGIEVVNAAPALTPEEQLDSTVNDAYALAEQQIREGTASPSIILHFLKMTSPEKKEELEKLRLENELLKAKTEAIRSSARMEEAYSKVIDAMRMYSGQTDYDPEAEEEELY